MSAQIPSTADIGLHKLTAGIEEVLWFDFDSKRFWRQLISEIDFRDQEKQREQERGSILEISRSRAIDMLHIIGRNHINCPQGDLASGDFIERRLLEALNLKEWPNG